MVAVTENRREDVKNLDYFWDRLNVAQKFSVSELQRFGSDASYYLLVRPGMTGLWQTSGRSSLDYDKRVYLDAWYVKNWSFWYDLIILFRTVHVVFSKDGAY